MSPNPIPGGTTIPHLVKKGSTSSLTRFRAAKALDERLNVPDLGDPNLRPFPLPKKADPLRSLSGLIDEREAAAAADEAQIEPAKRLLEAEDLEDFFREYLETCISAPHQPSKPGDPAPAPRHEGELDRFGDAVGTLEAPPRFRECTVHFKWTCSFCHLGSDAMEDPVWAKKKKYADCFGYAACKACLPFLERGEVPPVAPQFAEERWDGQEFRRQVEELVLFGDGEPSAPDLAEGPIWEAVSLTALRDEEVQRAGEPLKPRRRCSTEKRDALLGRLGVPLHKRDGDQNANDSSSDSEAEKEKEAGKPEGVLGPPKHLDAHLAFVAASKAAIAELRALASSSEERPIAKRRDEQEESKGWATAASSSLSKAQESRAWHLLNRQRKAGRISSHIKGMKVSQEFLRSLKRAQQELEALASSEAGSTSHKRTPREASKEVSELLLSASRKEQLAEAMSSSPTLVYGRRDPAEMTGKLLRLCGTFVEISCLLRGRNYGPSNTPGPGKYAVAVRPRSLYCPHRPVPFAVDPVDRENRRGSLAKALSSMPSKVFLDVHSSAYDSSADPNLFPAMRVVSPFRRIFKFSVLVWDMVLEAHYKSQEKPDRSPGRDAGSPPATPSSRGRISPSNKAANAAPAVKVPEKFFGVRLGDVQNLVETHRAWFEEERMCPFTKRKRRKTMYDVCPELIIPATTCQERIVTLQEGDLEKLRSRFDDPPGVLYSCSDLTIDPALDSVRLGGIDVPGGLTIHGKLVRGGPVRQKYWARGPERSCFWKTLRCHGREEGNLFHLAPIPQELLKGGGILGEESDRVWNTSDLKVGDVVVLRRGVSFIDMAAGAGPKSPLDSFASHFWGEETVDFLRTLVNHAEAMEKLGGVKALDRSYYICTFNNNQHRVELGSTWKTSPFNKALEFVADMAQLDTTRPRDAVMVFDSEAKPLQRKWCVFEAWRCTELELPLRLYCPDGEITRNSVSHSKTAEEVLRMVAEIDVEKAACSVKADADMINRAIEDAPGGFAAVHAKLRTRVLDLMTFIGSLAVSIDPMTGLRVEEVELQVRGKHPALVTGKMMPARDIAQDMCSPDTELGRNVLLVAPAGSGKSVFSRALVRHAVDASRANLEKGLPEVLPIRVPLAELAKVVMRVRKNNKARQKALATQLLRGFVTQQGYDKAYRILENPDFKKIFESWAHKAFLRDSEEVLSDKEGRQRLLILDGFDEAGQSRAEIITWLRSYLKDHPNVRTLLTTRPSGLDGVGMSTGRARAVRRGSLSHVDRDAGLVCISEAFPIGTLLKVQAGDRGSEDLVVEQEHVVLPRSDVLEQLRPNQSVLRAVGDDRALEHALCLEPRSRQAGFEVDLLPPEGAVNVQAARGIIEILDERTVTTNIRRAKERKHKDMDYKMAVEDVVSVTVTRAAEGHRVGGIVRIKKESLSRHKLSVVQEELRKVKQELAAIQPGAYGAENRRDTLEARKVDLEQLRRRLENTKGEGQDLELKVMQDLTYVRLKTVGGDPAPLEDMQQGGDAEELLIREQLTRELRFADFEVDTITSDAAAAIARNVGGGNLRSFHESMLENFPNNLWDRPLMANLFGQYLQHSGVAHALELSPAVAELEIFRFITQKLIHQAAAVVAPNSRKETVEAESGKIYSLLMEASRQKMNRNERLWHKANLRHLYEDAIRGHFRLFEPQEGSENSRPVQFYHYRIQELLAAEAWNKSGLSMERASRSMVSKEGLVSTGLAPLKFLVQAKLSQQADSLNLLLDFTSDGESQNRSCDTRLVTNINRWLPTTLSTLELHFPPLHLKENTAKKVASVPLDSSFEMALPPTLRVLKLDFQACKIDDNGLRCLGLPRLEALNLLELDASNCGVTDAGLFSLAAGLPQNLKKLRLEARRMEHHSQMKMRLKGGMGEVAGVYTLTGWHSDEDGRPRPYYVRDGSESQEPRCIKFSRGMWALFPCDIAATNADERPAPFCTVDEDESDWFPPTSGWRSNAEIFRNEGDERIQVTICSARPAFSAFGKSLPKDLETLKLNISATQVDDDGLQELGQSLPHKLKELCLTTQACKNLRSNGPSRLCKSLPSELQHLRLDLRLSLNSRDMGSELGECLPRGLKTFELVCNRKLQDDKLSGLSEQLPASLQRLTLDLRRSPLTNEGLRTLGSFLPKGLLSLTLSCELCRMVSTGAGDVCRALPASLQELSLDFEMCRLLEEDSLELLGANLPQGLRSLDLDVASCKRLRGHGLAKACRQLPPSLRKLRIAAAGLEEAMDEGLMAVGGGIPKGLEELTLDCSRSTSVTSSSVLGLGKLLPNGLKCLRLALKRCTSLDDEVLKLPLTKGLESLALDLSYCQGITDRGLSELSSTFASVPSCGSKSLQLAFHECGKVTSVGLKGVQDAATKSPGLLPINFDRRTMTGRRRVS